MGFFTEDERQQLRIHNMILHVVGDGEFEPQPARAVEHAPFFLSRIRDTDAAAVHEFRQRSRTRDALAEIAVGAVEFEAGAQAISDSFSGQHRNTARDGAFFIFELRVDDPAVRIYSLIKYDYREAIEQAVEEDGQQRLRQIVHAFIDDKKAIQKSALIRITSGAAESQVSARDRTKTSPDIADYFSAFLEVDRARSDEELNRALLEALRQVMVASTDYLPNNDAAAALSAAKAHLRDRQQIDQEAIIESVFAAAGHPNEEVQLVLRHRTTRKLQSQRLTGLAFPPDRQVLRRPPLRKLRTTEGVTVTYPDGVMVARVQREDGPGEVITITTDRIVEETIVREGSR
ncbi:nucleoid-associated protein [Stenotrophomonas sp. NRRL B-14846]|uniref:nucleoid-associated protein n=1 Tax=Stenotrophomonas sp. NRRL B-14846 TaxID=3162882 RepID=UPI003D2D9489